MSSNPLEYLITGIISIILIGFVAVLFLRPDLIQMTSDSPIQDGVLLQKAQIFVDYRVQLSQVSLDLDFFTDNRFRSIRTDRVFIPEQRIGKPQLFENSSVSNF
jgi:hypothetical protein